MFSSAIPFYTPIKPRNQITEIPTSVIHFETMQNSKQPPRRTMQTRRKASKNDLLFSSLPPELICLIFNRIGSLKEKFLLKRVSKKWSLFLTTQVISRQKKLSISKHFSNCRCPVDGHQFMFGDTKESIPLTPVKAALKRKKFFQNDMPQLKVVKFSGSGRDEERIKSYFLQEGPCEGV